MFALRRFFGDEVIQRSELSPIEHVIVDWCRITRENVLIKNNGEERYEDFKLYKMIARTVHHHTPKRSFRIYSKNIFRKTKSKKNITTVDIDSIPDYIKLRSIGKAGVTFTVFKGASRITPSLSNAIKDPTTLTKTTKEFSQCSVSYYH